MSGQTGSILVRCLPCQNILNWHGLPEQPDCVFNTANQPVRQPALYSSRQNGMSKSWAACLGLACLLPLGGCASMQVRMGLKVPLDKTPITSMTAKLRDSSGIAPGQKSQIMITMTEPGGKV